MWAATVALSAILVNSVVSGVSAHTPEFIRKHTPQSRLKLNGLTLSPDFIFGCGTSAYQVEGAWNEGGKTPSVWDTFAHEKGKNHIANDEDGNVAMDFYHTYAHDIPLFVDSIGVNNYDYTISWPRILPHGGRGQTPNEEGVGFYRRVAEATHKAGASTSCTLYHWDLVSTAPNRDTQQPALTLALFLAFSSAPKAAE